MNICRAPLKLTASVCSGFRARTCDIFKGRTLFLGSEK